MPDPCLLPLLFVAPPFCWQQEQKGFLWQRLLEEEASSPVVTCPLTWTVEDIPEHLISQCPLMKGANCGVDRVQVAEGAARKRKLDAEVASLSERPQLGPLEVFDELHKISKLSWRDQQPAKALWPEWFEFRTNCHASSRSVRSKAHKLLHGTPGMSKKKLCDIAGISPPGLTKFLENKGECYDRTGCTCSAESGLLNVLNILDQTADTPEKKAERLRDLLKHGLGHGNLGERGKWSDEKLARFRKAFPAISLGTKARKAQ